MRRPIVGLISNYNHNYLFGSSVVIVPEKQSAKSYVLDFLRGRHISDRSLEKVTSMTVIDEDTMYTISNVYFWNTIHHSEV